MRNSSPMRKLCRFMVQRAGGSEERQFLVHYSLYGPGVGALVFDDILAVGIITIRLR